MKSKTYIEKVFQMWQVLVSVLSALLIATAFVAWPILGKYSGASGSLIGIIIMGGSSVVVWGMSLLTADGLGTIPNTRSLVILILASIANGVGVAFFSWNTSNPAIVTGVFITSVSILMAVVAPCIDWYVNGSALSLRQVGGCCLAVLAIYLLQK